MDIATTTHLNAIGPVSAHPCEQKNSTELGSSRRRATWNSKFGDQSLLISIKELTFPVSWGLTSRFQTQALEAMCYNWFALG